MKVLVRHGGLVHRSVWQTPLCIFRKLVEENGLESFIIDPSITGEIVDGVVVDCLVCLALPSRSNE